MLILAGVCVVALGAGGIVGICTEAARYNEFPSSMLSPLFISALIFMIGVLMIFIPVVKKRNHDRLDFMRGPTGDGERQAVCSNCGLNVVPDITICPKCGSTISRK